jgi:hypothetical protein
MTEVSPPQAAASLDRADKAGFPDIDAVLIPFM